jgi:hypothetical protein
MRDPHLSCRLPATSRSNPTHGFLCREAEERRRARKGAKDADSMARRTTEAEELSKKLMDFMQVSVGARSDFPTKDFGEYVQDYFNLNRKGEFNCAVY